MRGVRRVGAGVWVLAFAGGCGVVSYDEADAPWSADEAPLDEGEALGAASPWEAAAAAWDVPVDLLRAIALAETGFQAIQGEPHDGRPVAFGVMALRSPQLERGAQAAGWSTTDVQTRLYANIEAAAALLRGYADARGIDRGSLAAWAPAVADLSGITDAEAAAQHVWDGVYAPLRTGFAVEGATVKAWAIDPDYPAPVYRRSVAGPNYASTVWRPSPNFDSRNSAVNDIDMVVIHSCEGSYSGCWSWQVNDSSDVSAHYTVKEDGSEITQLVDESNRAWHVGATYDSGLNGGTNTRFDGWNVNHFSVGIEHAGFAAQSTWDNGLLDASAALTCDITRDHGIPIDSYHIVAHGRLQPYNRTDPGANWPWSDYLNRVAVACGQPSAGGATPAPQAPTGQIIIDSNNSYNDASVARNEVSGNWTSSQNVRGYWNTGYYYASTAATSDPAHFRFFAASGGCYTVEAWWTAARDRSQAAPWTFRNAAGASVGTATTDQQTSHSQWNALGQATFTAGWNTVDLDRNAALGQVVVADAVRVTPCGGGSAGSGGSGSGGSSGGAGTLSLSQGAPGDANLVNRFTITGATPGARVSVIAGRAGGPSAAPGCAGLDLPIRAPWDLGYATADASGDATFDFLVPARAAGQAIDLYAVEASTCRASTGVRQTF